MRLEVLSIIPRAKIDDLILTDSVLSLTTSGRWIDVKGDQHSLRYRAYEANLRWPILLQVQCHLMRYDVGDFISPHKDVIKAGERQFRIQFILRNAARGGELRCERFIVNTRWFKIFEPCRWTHSVTPVEEGLRILINLGIRYSWRRIRPCPF